MARPRLCLVLRLEALSVCPARRLVRAFKFQCVDSVGPACVLAQRERATHVTADGGGHRVGAVEEQCCSWAPPSPQPLSQRACSCFSSLGEHTDLSLLSLGTSLFSTEDCVCQEKLLPSSGQGGQTLGHLLMIVIHIIMPADVTCAQENDN